MMDIDSRAIKKKVVALMDWYQSTIIAEQQGLCSCRDLHLLCNKTVVYIQGLVCLFYNRRHLCPVLLCDLLFFFLIY
jgi:hypothetical protein